MMVLWNIKSLFRNRYITDTIRWRHLQSHLWYVVIEYIARKQITKLSFNTKKGPFTSESYRISTYSFWQVERSDFAWLTIQVGGKEIYLSTTLQDASSMSYIAANMTSKEDSIFFTLMKNALLFGWFARHIREHAPRRRIEHRNISALSYKRYIPPVINLSEPMEWWLPLGYGVDRWKSAN